jgi:hypothetical protein
MSSLRPTSLVIGNEDDDGEFNPFSHVGALLSGGGGGTKREVWVLSHKSPVCLGKIGVSSKFCIKLCANGKNHCGVLRHSAKFRVAENTAYVHATDHQVFCQPCLELSNLSLAQ